MDLLATKISHEPTPPQQSSTTRLFSRPSPSPLKEENYPKIRFWQEDAYTKLLKQEELDGIVHDGAGFKGRVAISKGYNVKNRYIEHSDGTVIDGHRLDRAFEKCHELFWQVEGVGLLPATWKQMRADVVAFIFTELELDFPELQLCELHWKARRLAHYKFGTWYNDNKKKFSSPNVKQEASTAPAIPDAILPAVKRSRSSTDDGKVREEKKSKVTAVASSQGEIHVSFSITLATWVYYDHGILVTAYRSHTYCMVCWSAGLLTTCNELNTLISIALSLHWQRHPCRLQCRSNPNHGLRRSHLAPLVQRPSLTNL